MTVPLPWGPLTRWYSCLTNRCVPDSRSPSRNQKLPWWRCGMSPWNIPDVAECWDRSILLCSLARHWWLPVLPALASRVCCSCWLDLSCPTRESANCVVVCSLPGWVNTRLGKLHTTTQLEIGRAHV